MTPNNNDTKNLKRETLVRVIRAALGDNFAEEICRIPFDLRPKKETAPYHCCLHKERAALTQHILADLGFAIEETDEQKPLSEYAQQALSRTQDSEGPLLTVLDTACQACTSSRIYITDMCQGCIARPCINTCRFGAISMVNGRSVIDATKCKSCGMCLNVCPYKAIAKIIVPCENACPVGAITKNSHGQAQIDSHKCISCGKCVNGCPFGAIHERRQIIEVIRALKQKQRVIAMVAPSIAGQLPGSMEQLHTALKKVGFTKVYEVAFGADITSKHEAKDLAERLERGDKFMTTSCCAGYNTFVDKHLPEMKPYRSETQTPLYYTAELVKQEHADSISVFFSPCITKRIEVMQNPNVDYSVTFEELGALFEALEIDLTACAPEPFTQAASKQGRAFGLTQGVSQAVIATAPDAQAAKICPVCINGLNKESIKELKKYAKTGACELGNLVEVMCCEGGCIGGNAVLNALRISTKKVTQYANEGQDIEKIQD